MARSSRTRSSIGGSTRIKVDEDRVEVRGKGNKIQKTEASEPQALDHDIGTQIQADLAKITRNPGTRLIPSIPSHKVDVYVFGSGAMAELGLGPTVTEVKRPRRNPYLTTDKVGITKISAGGAHVIAIDYNGDLWTWGQNDTKALGRDTKIEDGDADEDFDLNFKESTPAKVEMPYKVKFIDVAATDNLSAAVSSDGGLYAWGTFLDEGKKSFNSRVELQPVPLKITGISGAVQIAAGKDHLLILTKNGDVFAWGLNNSYQLGAGGLSQMRTRHWAPPIIKLNSFMNGVRCRWVGAGEYHSFAIDVKGYVYAWGLNNFGQCGIAEDVQSGAVLKTPTRVEFFDDKKIVHIAGGNHHSLALTASGDIYAFGEMNFHQLGLDPENLPESTVREENGTPGFVPVPTLIQHPGLPKFKWVATGTDHSLAVDVDGGPWTWGFGTTYQLGHGNAEDEDEPEDEQVPRKIENTAVRAASMTFATAGGQFSVLTGNLNLENNKPVQQPAPQPVETTIKQPQESAAEVDEEKPVKVAVEEPKAVASKLDKPAKAVRAKRGLETDEQPEEKSRSSKRSKKISSIGDSNGNHKKVQSNDDINGQTNGKANGNK